MREPDTDRTLPSREINSTTEDSSIENESNDHRKSIHQINNQVSWSLALNSLGLNQNPINNLKVQLKRLDG